MGINRDELRMMSGVITRTEQLNGLNENKLEENVMNTISHPLLSGKALQMFTAEMKRWKEAGFITKWQKNRFFSKIKIYVKGMKDPYVINITNILGKSEEEGSTGKEKLKSRLIGKVKSPHRFFQTFKNWGFYEIVDKMFDLIEDDIDKEKPRPKDMEDEAWEKLETELSQSMATARKKVMIFRQIDKGNFSVNMSEDVELDEMALAEMAKADIKDIDVTKAIEEVAEQYKKNWETRMKKEFSARAVPSVSKSFTAPEIGDPVQAYLAAQYPKSAKSKGAAFKASPAQIEAAKEFIAKVGSKDARKVLNAALK